MAELRRFFIGGSLELEDLSYVWILRNLQGDFCLWVDFTLGSYAPVFWESAQSRLRPPNSSLLQSGLGLFLSVAPVGDLSPILEAHTDLTGEL